MEMFNKIKQWFTRSYEPEESLSEYEMISLLNPECFSKVHSSDFTMYKVRTYTKSLDEFNRLLTKIVDTLDKPKYPRVDFSNIFEIELSEFFLKKGNYANEKELIKTFIDLNLKILEWVVSKELDVEDDDIKYKIVIRIFTSSMSLVKLFLEIQNH